MAHFIQAVDRAHLAGRPWLFIEEANGDTRFLIASDCAEPVELSGPALLRVIAAIDERLAATG